MSITTKRGDAGMTDLLFGGRARKDSPRVEAMGVIDELNCLIGLARCEARSAKTRALLRECQRTVFIVGSEIAVLPRNGRKLQRRIDAGSVQCLETELRRMESRVQLKGCCFMIPGANRESALLDVARCAARRAERLAVSLCRKKALGNARVPVCLNRLSDLLYLLARAAEKKRDPFIARPR